MVFHIVGLLAVASTLVQVLQKNIPALLKVQQLSDALAHDSVASLVTASASVLASHDTPMELRNVSE